MTSFSSEEISRRLSHTLDCLGYSAEMVKQRKYLYNNAGFVRNTCSESFTSLIRIETVGSRGDGLVKLHESDWDVLYLFKHVLAVENNMNIDRIPEWVGLYEMVPCLLHHGHVKLLLKRQDLQFDSLQSFLNPSENGCWLSRKEILSVFTADGMKVSGPAHTEQNTLIPSDSVISLPCVCPRIIQQWIQRPRRYDWPPVEVRESISHMPANVVATGPKGCPDEEIEWRLCFNEIEMLIVNSWNDTQKKLYIVLKMIKKDVLVRAGFAISSYIMKNIVLWLSEAYPQSAFKPECLMLWIIKSLRLLRKAVKMYNLPYYMIPERNLISERIPRRQCRSLMREISDLVRCGPQLLWECKKLEFAMSMTPNELLLYKDRSDRLEVLILSAMCQTSLDMDISIHCCQIEHLVVYTKWPQAITEMLKNTSKSECEEILKVLVG